MLSYLLLLLCSWTYQHILSSDPTQANITETITHCVTVQQGHSTLSRAPTQELYDPSMKTSTANLDDLQRSWETLKNVVSYRESCFRLIGHNWTKSVISVNF